MPSQIYHFGFVFRCKLVTHGSEAGDVEVIFASNSLGDMVGYQVGSSAQGLIRPLFIV